MKTLSRSFYSRDTVKVARDLLGKRLIHKIKSNIISGIITETEAYRFEDDPASHAFRGETQRNKIMFEQVGTAYVYFTYGMHYCVNAVARSPKFEAGAVLIRALKPEEGLKQMMKNRRTDVISNLTNGPAKLTQALQISKKQYGEDLTKTSGLFVAEGIVVNKIISGPRIGIKKGIEKNWNFKINLA